MDEIRRITVDSYHKMIQHGILTKDDKVELIEGYIVAKARPRTPPHDSTIQRLQEPLFKVLPPGWDLRIGSGVTLADSEPEPDLAVVRGDARDYATRHPGPADVALLVEVADLSLAFDRTDKLRIYARAGIGVYWLVNLVDQQVEVYTAPSGPTAAPAYGQRQDYGLSDTVPFGLDGQPVAQFAVADLLA